MAWKRTRGDLCCSILAGPAVFGVAAAAPHGQGTLYGVPVPGATGTATQDDKKLVAVTDPRGVYSFPDLADGVWTIQVEMLCFATLKQEVGVSASAPSPEWELKLLPLDEMKAVSAPQPAPAVADSSTANVTIAVADDKNRSSAPPAPAKGKANDKKSSPASPANSQSGFQRTDLNASGDTAGADSGLAAGDSNASAADAFVVNGSVSNGIERRAIGNARKGPGFRYNGDVNFVLDNSALNARSFSLTGQNTPQTAYNHLRFGASFGGPLLIPHVFRWNGQFFLNYQMT